MTTMYATISVLLEPSMYDSDPDAAAQLLADQIELAAPMLRVVAVDIQIKTDKGVEQARLTRRRKPTAAQ